LDSLRQRLGTFWTFFNPNFLFISGDGSLINSTREIGFFALALAAFLPIGAYRLAPGLGGLVGYVILAGFITAPLAAVISGALEMNRRFFAVPFGVLVAAHGLEALLQTPACRIAVILLLATIPWQFVGFYRYYIGGYQSPRRR
jgi:hypothetical protein